MKNRYVRIGLIVMLSLMLVVLCGILFLSVFYVLEDSKENGDTIRSKITSYRYRMFSYDPELDSSSIGLVSLLSEVGEDGFVSYTNTEGKYILISDFDNDEYRCTGSCFCDDERRSTSIPFTRGLLYFVAATTSLLAVNHAKEHFDKECVELMKKGEEYCDVNSIQSEVEDCGLVKVHAKKKKKKKKEVDMVTDVDMIDVWKKGYGSFQKFLCSGKCRPRRMKLEHEKQFKKDAVDKDTKRLYRKNFKPMQIEANNFECEKLEMEEYITLPVHVGSNIDETTLAKFEFITKHLHPHCVSKSHSKLELKLKQGQEEQVFSIETPLCTSNYGGNNPMVKCVHTSDSKDMLSYSGVNKYKGPEAEEEVDDDW